MYDVLIIGGSYAGLAAALQLVRARKRVLILDAGQRRNRFVRHSHGFLGQDGQDPAAIAAKGRAEVLAYPTARYREAQVTEARVAEDGFVVRAGGEEYRGRRLLLATGVVDELPAIPGLAERWGREVFLCPYCDGYERQLGRLGILNSGAHSTHFAAVVNEWAGRGLATFFVADAAEPEPEPLADLRRRGVTIERRRVLRVSGESPTIDVQLVDGAAVTLDALFVLPRTRLAVPFAEQLGLALDQAPLGPIYKTDPMTKETTVPGVYACGDAALLMPSVSFAVADGVRAGVGIHASLIFERG